MADAIHQVKARGQWGPEEREASDDEVQVLREVLRAVRRIRHG